MTEPQFAVALIVVVLLGLGAVVVVKAVIGG